MTDILRDLPPCAGSTEGDGCAAFERYFVNERAFLGQYVEAEDPEAADNQEILARVALLDKPEALRRRLHGDFVLANFCVLACVQADELPANVVQLRPPDITHAGCTFAIDYERLLGKTRRPGRRR